MFEVIVIISLLGLLSFSIYKFIRISRIEKSLVVLSNIERNTANIEDMRRQLSDIKEKMIKKGLL
jgi:hypothetical protein